MDAETTIDITAEMQLFGILGSLGEGLIRRKADAMLSEFAEHADGTTKPLTHESARTRPPGYE